MSLDGAQLKDSALDEIAKRGFNVARFVSAGPSGDVRHARLSPTEGHQGDYFPELVASLFRLGAETVNVRCFRPSQSQGNPFEYGITSPAEAVAVASRYMAEGYFVIVNETVDVNDGGVSGVCEGGLWEFAPSATPRVVETGMVCRLPSPIARPLLESVYGAKPDLDDSQGWRVEFSLHPYPVGYLQTKTLLWEVSKSPAVRLAGPINWPNPFSCHIGDKAFGLMMADAVGLKVPRTLVIARDVPPFSFGTNTGMAQRWTRTAPRSPKPGLFTTVQGWTDPFRIMMQEDPSGTDIASVLFQDAVAPKFSGAALPRKSNTDYLVEGVEGKGDLFMLGQAPPASLPGGISRDVRAALLAASERLGSVRAEWVHDGNQVWIVQMHKAKDQSAEEGVIVSGTPRNGWLAFSPSDGLTSLSQAIEDARKQGLGVRVTGPVGVTSHVGDLLRRAAVPAVVDYR